MRREQSRAGGDSPIHQQLVDTTGNCLSTRLEMKFKSGAYATAFWQGDKLRGVRGPQMDALKEGRCLLHRVPLHQACFGISGMDGLAMFKKCSPAVIRSFRIAGTERVPRAAPVTSPGFHQRWSWLGPPQGCQQGSSSLRPPRTGRTCSSRLGFNPAPAPAGFTAGQRTWPLLGVGERRTMGRTRSHTSCTASFLLHAAISLH